MLDGLHGLRHDAVVGRHHQHHDVGGLGAARAHGGEGRVAGRVQEGDDALARLHLVGADVLGDAAGLPGRHLGAADVIEERGLAVIDVAHDRDHRRARLEVRLGRAPCAPCRSSSIWFSFSSLAVWPISSTTSTAVSWSIGWLMVAMTPMFMSTLMTSFALTAIFCASSATVMVSPMPTSRSTGAVGISKPCRPSARRRAPAAP